MDPQLSFDVYYSPSDLLVAALEFFENRTHPDFGGGHPGGWVQKIDRKSEIGVGGDGGWGMGADALGGRKACPGQPPPRFWGVGDQGRGSLWARIWGPP